MAMFRSSSYENPSTTAALPSPPAPSQPWLIIKNIILFSLETAMAMLESMKLVFLRDKWTSST